MPETPLSSAGADGILRHFDRVSQGGDAGGGSPSLRTTVRRPLAIVALIARRDGLADLSRILAEEWGMALPDQGRSSVGNEMELRWSGPARFLAISRRDGLGQRLAQGLGASVSLFDQSHGTVAVDLEGTAARRVLASGTPIDLDPSVFGIGHCASTQIAHVPVHLCRCQQATFELCFPRSYAQHIGEWLANVRSTL